MNKKEVQKRVLQNGKPPALIKFSWNEKTKTFSTTENNLVIDFAGIDCVNFITGSLCTFNTGSYCTFNTGSKCTFNTGFDCTFNTGFDCTFDTGFDCTFNTGSDCIFKTGSKCTFNTGFDCTFDTGSDCIFKTDYHCTFNTGSNCTFNTGSECVVIRRDMYQVIELEENKTTQLAPYGVKGYLVDGIYSETSKPAIIADGILSKVLSEKKVGNIAIYKIRNYNQSKSSYLIKAGDVYSHGATLEEAKESLKYKIADRDTSKFEHLTLDSTITEAEAIQLYRTVTGACESGTRYFVENLKEKPDRLTVRELIELTKGQYNHKELIKFFKGEK